MTFIPKEPLFIGIDSDAKRMAIVKKKGKGFVFVELVEGLLEDLFKKIPKDESGVISVPTKDVLVKNLSLPFKGEKEIRAAFAFQIEPLLPYPIDKCVVKYVKAQEKEQGSLLTSFSVKKEVVARKVAEIGTDGNYISTPALALAALAQEIESKDSSFFFVYIGKEGGTFAVFEKGNILTARFFEKEKSEAEKTYLACQALYKNKKIETLYLISEEEGYEKLFSEISGHPVETPLFPNLPITHEILRKYGLAIGLALSKAKNLPNLQENDSLMFSWKKIKKPIMVAALLLTTLFTTVYFIGSREVAKRKDELFSRYHALLKEEAPSSLPELDMKLDQFQKKLDEEPDLYPLVPVVPKISDFIAWMTAEFPNVFKIEEFRYHLKERPDFNNHEESYGVLVNMRVAIENPSVAEAIRTLLSTSNPFVDTKKDFGWEIDKGKYQATFYLKDKTRYS